jgi:hypothetical protein
MKNKYLLLFLLGFTISSNAQVCSKDIILTARDYRECAIDTLYLNGEFHKSLELSLQNIILYPKDTDYIYIHKNKPGLNQFNISKIFGNVVRAYAAIDNMDSSIIWLDRLKKINKTLSLDFLCWNEFRPLFNNSKFQNYYKHELDSIKQKNPSFNSEYYIALSQNCFKDQIYVTTLATYNKLLSSSFKLRMQDLYRKTLNENLANADLLRLKYGYPTKNIITTNGIDKMLFLVKHLSPDNPRKYDFQWIFEQAYLSGSMSIEDYAKFTDKNFIYSNCPQKYGTQYWFDNATQQYYYFPIEDLQNIDKIRKEIGLYSIKDQNSSIGLKEIQIKSNGIQY